VDRARCGRRGGNEDYYYARQSYGFRPQPAVLDGLYSGHFFNTGMRTIPVALLVFILVVLVLVVGRSITSSWGS